MTFIEAFEKIKNEFKEADAKKIKDNIAVQINFTDEDCNGIFYVEVKDGNLYVEPYDYYDRNAMLSADFKQLKNIFSGKTDVKKAIEEGKVYAEGSIEAISEIAKTIKKKTVSAEKKTKKTVKKAAKAIDEKIDDASKKVKKTSKKAVKVADKAAQKLSQTSMNIADKVEATSENIKEKLKSEKE